ncbi:MAG: trypsin-like peptidase domain-containing protein [Patescibacteria group bacterium]
MEEEIKPVRKKSNLLVSIILSLLIGSSAGGVFGFLGSQVSNWLENDENMSQTSKNVTNEIENESASIAAIEKVSPSVVSIVASKYFDDNYYYDYFWDEYYYEEDTGGEEGELQEIGGGTGFILSKDGMIITNKHVVEDTEAEYSVVMSDGTRYDNVEVLSRDPFNDIAVLKLVDVKDLDVAELGDSDNLEIGQTVLAIGYALAEYENSATKGIVSGLGRELVATGYDASSQSLEKLIQTDTPINPGNSGGPLINLSGKVIGINVAVDWGGQSIGFAIPINMAKSAIDSVKKHGTIIRPLLGVRYIPITKDIASTNNIDYEYGVLVIKGDNPAELAVMPGSAADKAGIEENDIILEIDGQKIDKDNTLLKMIQQYSVDDKIKIKISHDGEEKEVEVVLEAMNDK